MKKTLVLGIGNLLLGDEGVGVHAARALMGEECPYGTVVREVGTAILDALPNLATAHRVIILDAIKNDGNPGTVYRIPLGQCRKSRWIASMHGFDIVGVLALLGRQNPPEVVVFGVEPKYLNWSTKLSAPVSAAIPFLLEAVRREIN